MKNTCKENTYAMKSHLKLNGEPVQEVETL